MPLKLCASFPLMLSPDDTSIFRCLPPLKMSLRTERRGTVTSSTEPLNKRGESKFVCSLSLTSDCSIQSSFVGITG